MSAPGVQEIREANDNRSQLQPGHALGMLPESCDPEATAGPVVDPSHNPEHIAAAFTRECRTCALAYRCGNKGRTGLADIRVKAAEAPVVSLNVFLKGR